VKRSILATYGQPRRRDFVRVVNASVRGTPVVAVQWKEGDRRKHQSFPATRKGAVEAKAFAEAQSDRLAARQVQVDYTFLTVRQVFERYINAKVDEWRPRTLELKRDRWQPFELLVGKRTPAHLINREHIDDLKRVMLDNKHSPNQVAHHITNALAVFRWAVDRDLIPPTKLTSYKVKFGKDVLRKKVQMAEYSPEERRKILAQLSPRNANQWRAWALTTLLAYCGPRENAALRLEWADVELDGMKGRVRWRPENDKMGSDRVQPLPIEVVEAMYVALGWRGDYNGRFVFYSARKKVVAADRPYTFQAYTYALHGAEKRAGVPHIKYRAAHGMRRGIAKDIYDLTGSEHKAAEWLGDKSVRVVKESYLLEREDSMRELASLAGQKMQPIANRNENSTQESAETEG
jgi:integrase